MLKVITLADIMLLLILVSGCLLIAGIGTFMIVSAGWYITHLFRIFSSKVKGEEKS